MAFLFMGGEDIDFSRLINGVAVDPNTTFFRTNFARCSLAVPPGGELSAMAQATFAAPSSGFWFTGRMSYDPSYVNSDFQTFLAFTDGGNKRLAFQMRADMSARIVKYDNTGTANNITTYTQPAFPKQASLQRIDVQVVYAATGGRLRLFVNGVVSIDISTDPTTGGSTSLNGFWIANPHTGNTAMRWSEMIVAERDTRTLNLKTHAPVATAQGHAWIGQQTDVNEVILDESTMITTTGLDQPAKFTVSPLPDGNFAVRAFKVSTWAARGETGPQHLDVGVNVGGTDYYGPDQTLDTGFGPINQIFDANPVTNAPWSNGDIATIQIAAKSRS